MPGEIPKHVVISGHNKTDEFQVRFFPGANSLRFFRRPRGNGGWTEQAPSEIYRLERITFYELSKDGTKSCERLSFDSIPGTGHDPKKSGSWLRWTPDKVLFVELYIPLLVGSPPTTNSKGPRYINIQFNLPPKIRTAAGKLRIDGLYIDGKQKGLKGVRSLRDWSHAPFRRSMAAPNGLFLRSVLSLPQVQGNKHKRTVTVELLAPNSDAPEEENVYLLSTARRVTGLSGAQRANFRPVRPRRDEDHARLQTEFTIRAVQRPSGFPGDANWTIHIEPIPTGELMRLWNEWVARPHVAGLNAVTQGQSISLAPLFRGFGDTKQAWRFMFDLRDSSPHDYASGESARYTVRFRSIQPNTSTAPAKGTAVPVELRNLVDHDGEAVRFKGSLTWKPPLREDDKGGWRRRCVHPTDTTISLKLTSSGGAESKTPVRLGALDLHPATGANAKALDMTLVATVPPNPPAGVDDIVTVVRPPPTLRLGGSVKLTALSPGGQDAIPDALRVDSASADAGELMGEGEAWIEHQFHRDAPVVVPLSRGTSKHGFKLKIDERTEVGLTRALELRLDQESGAAEDVTPIEALVLDRQPFLVARVSSPALVGTDAGFEVGNWQLTERGGASWLLINPDERAEIDLPPQATGEEMEKGFGWGADDGARRPVIPEGANAKAIGFRFSPPTRLSIDPSYFEQRFSEAPWNLRRILGYPGQRAPGVGLARMQFELLYGLWGDAAPSDLRLTELAALMGATPGRLPPPPRVSAASGQGEEEGLGGMQRRVYARHRKDWSAAFQTYSSRLGALRPWNDGRPDDEVRISQGLEYRFRKHAKMKYPLPNEKMPDDLAGHAAPADLRGGVAWGFESKNIYDRVNRSRVSDDGELVDPVFSALGGWGFQKARFDDRRTTIYSNTSMGRLDYYCVERIGRIGVFWHRAKHVIVYRRVPAASRQFRREQPENKGRMLLRKVREYVEILEPHRSYPDFGEAPTARGCVIGCEFKQRIIPVNGRWGGDVEGGWTVPLWREDADQRIYPKPQVGFELAADPDAGVESSKAELDEPQKLVFYTNTVEGTGDDVHAWPTVRNVDYVDLLAPAPDNEPPMNPRAPDATVASPPPSEAGYSRFTYGVIPSAVLVNLVADRSESAVVARLKNVAMMRARPKVGTSDLAKRVVALVGGGDTVGRATAVLDAIRADLEAAAARGEQHISKELADALKAALAGIGTEADVKKLLDETAKLGKWPSAEDWRSKLLADAEKQAKLGKAKIDELVGDIGAELIDQVRRAGDLPTQGREALVEAAIDAVLRPADRQAAQLRNTAALLHTKFDDLLGQLARAEQGARAAQARLGDALDELEAGVARGRAGVERALRRARDEFRAAGRELARELAGVASARLKPVTELAKKVRDVQRLADARLASIETALRESGDVAKVKADVDAWLATGPVAMLDAKLKAVVDARHAIDSHIAEASNELAAWESSLRKELFAAINANDVETAVGDAVKDFRQFVDEKAELLDLKGARDELNNQVLDIKNSLKEAENWHKNQLEQTLKKALEANKPLVDAVKAFEDTLEQLPDFGAIEEQLREGVDNISNDLRMAGDQLGQVEDQTLRLVRAFGDAPIATALQFNRDQLAYFYDAVDAVKTSPTAAMVARVGEHLKPLGLRIPTRELLDGIIPDALEDFDLSSIFPDFAGMKLLGMFEGLKFPKINNDQIKVRPHFDKASMTASLVATVDVPFGGPAAGISAGPVRLNLIDAKFKAHAKITARPGGGDPTTDVKGSITADWEVVLGGLKIVTFTNTSLRFDGEGGFKFDVRPDRIRVPEAMQFLSDMVSSFGSPEDGFTLELVERNGLPSGVRAQLDIPIPPVGAGAFAVSGLRLGAGLELNVGYGGGGFDFSVEAGLFLGRKKQPFTITILFLGGGGWFEARAAYSIQSKKLLVRITIGIVAGAGVEFAFGPIYGGVYVQVGIFLEFAANSPSRRSGTTVGIMFLVRGSASLMGLVSVCISLLLEATYSSGGKMVARGSVSFKVKICWCFTINVSADVEYVFSEGSGEKNALDAPTEGEDVELEGAQQYYDMYA